nr:MAG TPA: hypothetical protein [Caudoviricetes sp.]
MLYLTKWSECLSDLRFLCIALGVFRLRKLWSFTDQKVSQFLH